MNSDNMRDEYPCERTGCQNLAYNPWAFCPVHGGHVRDFRSPSLEPAGPSK